MSKSTSANGTSHRRKKNSSNPELAPIGDNIGEDERRAAFLSGIGKIEKLNASKSKYAADASAEKKKLVDTGFTNDQIKDALWARKHSEAEIQARLESQMRTLKWCGQTVQLSLFDAGPSPYERGKTTGLEGKNQSESPYDAGSPEGQKWLEGWADGQKILGGKIKKTSAKKDAVVQASP